MKATGEDSEHRGAPAAMGTVLASAETERLGEAFMLRFITVVLVLIWLAGSIGHVGAGLIHFLLVLAAAALLIEIFGGRRSAA